ncbi:DUF4192 family protein [Arthrobacter sp. zg-Y1171]|uniref:DUF4192 family protein n=1 Tax=Arthrobacter sp. zg-Y1171 TaxID=2964610 RepID=UPI0021057C79|nr:DUF4192 family protein [Arthrobacter sp. zg-Y1171]MCQ1995888.1 DUF4192 domain-containing protein [Arthrobacter sp. zg-Y1171]UWX83033.1 DUF4192 domain-containing protein [Arthrobacter sp. zg-Y1171]
MSTEPADGTPRNPYRINAPADILSLVPHTLGFEPRESLVLMALCGGRLGATLRLDLPPGPGAKAGANAAYAAAACRFMAADTEADGVLLALYTDRPWKDPAHPPYRPLVRRLGKDLAAAGIPLQDGWLVGPDTWRDYFCTQPDCCPWPGAPRSQIADSMLNTELVYRGSAFAASLERAVGESFPLQWPNKGEVADSRARFGEQVGAHWCERDQFHRTLELWGNCFAGGVLDTGAEPYAEDAFEPFAGTRNRLHRDPECAGFLLASLSDRGIRDALLVLTAAGQAAAVYGAEANGLVRPQVHPVVLPGSADRGAAASGVVPLLPRPRRQSKAAADFRSILVGRGDAPDWSLLDRAYAVFSDLVPAADEDAKAALLSLLAWMEWARGRGSRAHVHLQHALDACPGYRLALLLRELLGTGILPDWTGSRDGSWPGTADGWPETPMNRC